MGAPQKVSLADRLGRSGVLLCRGFGWRSYQSDQGNRSRRGQTVVAESAERCVELLPGLVGVVVVHELVGDNVVAAICADLSDRRSDEVEVPVRVPVASSERCGDDPAVIDRHGNKRVGSWSARLATRNGEKDDLTVAVNAGQREPRCLGNRAAAEPAAAYAVQAVVDATGDSGKASRRSGHLPTLTNALTTKERAGLTDRVTQPWRRLELVTYPYFHATRA